MGNVVKNRDNWNSALFGDFVENFFDDKKILIQSYMNQLFRITLNMFIYEGLEDDERTKHITSWDIEKVIQGGYVTFYEFEGKIYPDYSAMGGGRKWNYTFDEVIVNNAWLRFNKTMKVDEDCIIIKNDSCYQGLVDLNKKYSTLFAEVDTSLYCDTILTRAMYILFAKDSNTAKSVKDFVDNLIKGKIAFIQSDNMLEDFEKGLESKEFTAKNTHLKDLVEVKQYLKGSWFNEIGLNSLFNMKRESLNSSETSANESALKPFVLDMLSCREEGIKKVNEKWGLNIKVKLNDSWIEEFIDKPVIKGVDEDENNKIETTTENDI